MSTTTTDPARKRAAMTFSLDPCRPYGYAMAALAELGPSSSTEVAAYLAARRTPFGGDGGTMVPGALGVGWYPMSTARLLTQVRLHGYPVKRDPESGLWTLGSGGSREVRGAIAECYRRAALDVRSPMISQSY